MTRCLPPGKPRADPASPRGFFLCACTVLHENAQEGRDGATRSSKRNTQTANDTRRETTQTIQNRLVGRYESRHRHGTVASMIASPPLAREGAGGRGSAGKIDWENGAGREAGQAKGREVGKGPSIMCELGAARSSPHGVRTALRRAPPLGLLIRSAFHFMKLDLLAPQASHAARSASVSFAEHTRSALMSPSRCGRRRATAGSRALSRSSSAGRGAPGHSAAASRGPPYAGHRVLGARLAPRTRSARAMEVRVSAWLSQTTGRKLRCLCAVD